MGEEAKEAHDEKEADEESDSEKDSEKEEDTEKASEKEEEKDSEKTEEKEEEGEKEEAKEESTEESTEESKEDEEAKKAEEAKAVEELKDTAVTMVAVPPSYAAFYGPGGCVTTYKGPSGTCVMETSCEGENMEGFTYGLMCVKGSERVRHVFMGDAFDPVESFDTLIDCDLCLGLDSAGSIGLGQEVSALKDEVKVLAEKVEKLEGATVTTTAAPAVNATASGNISGMFIHKTAKLSTHKAADDEDSSTPAPAAEKSEVEVDVIHHNHETKFLKSGKHAKLSSHSDWGPISARLNQPKPKRGVRAGQRINTGRWHK